MKTAEEILDKHCTELNNVSVEIKNFKSTIIIAMKEFAKEYHINQPDVVYSKKNIISLLEDRKNIFKPETYYKNERMRLTQAINTIKKLVPDF